MNPPLKLLLGTTVPALEQSPEVLRELPRKDRDAHSIEEVLGTGRPGCVNCATNRWKR